MKITFFSNFLNHHQLPFCLAMDKLTNGQFTFVATTPTQQEQLKLGYHDMNKQYPFVLTTYDSEENRAAAMALAMESDVIITGSAPEIYTQKRKKSRFLLYAVTRPKHVQTGRAAQRKLQKVFLHTEHIMQTGSLRMQWVWLLRFCAGTVYKSRMKNC